MNKQLFTRVVLAVTVFFLCLAVYFGVIKHLRSSFMVPADNTKTKTDVVTKVDVKTTTGLDKGVVRIRTEALPKSSENLQKSAHDFSKMARDRENNTDTPR